MYQPLDLKDTHDYHVVFRIDGQQLSGFVFLKASSKQRYRSEVYEKRGEETVSRSLIFGRLVRRELAPGGEAR